MLGEMTQLCKEHGIKCLCVQDSAESARVLVSVLGLGHEDSSFRPDSDPEEDTGPSHNPRLASELQEDTKAVLELLSAAEKVPIVGARPSKTLGSSASCTRSKGHALKWNKMLNAKNPVC